MKKFEATGISTSIYSFTFYVLIMKWKFDLPLMKDVKLSETSRIEIWLP